MTGSVGLKTTARRWSTVGITPLSRTLDTPGVLARTVSDAAMAFAVIDPLTDDHGERSEEHTSELQSLMRLSYAVFCLKKKKIHTTKTTITTAHIPQPHK